MQNPTSTQIFTGKKMTEESYSYLQLNFNVQNHALPFCLHISVIMFKIGLQCQTKNYYYTMIKATRNLQLSPLD